ncbi:Ig-like domain-containing protein, partial [Pimelobacter simplex]|uniref:Ig-like domain-containing protein n=1 Tax=Nocardioides simplex TaxID=2045 RepID=UPI0038159B95
MSQPTWRWPSSVLAVALLLLSGLALVSVAPPASAAAQNGYAFNERWRLQNPGSAATRDSVNNDATNVASSSVPTSTGAVGVTARFAPKGSQVAGTSYLTDGSDQTGHGGRASNFTGSPTPGSLPALGVVTSASTCGGAPGTAGHQNFEGACGVGTLTLDFSQPVTDPVLDISGLGGFVWRSESNRARGSFNATIWRIQTPGVTFASPSAGRTNLDVGATTLRPAQFNSNTRCDGQGQEGSGNTAGPRTTFAGCGSVVLQGTFSSVSFQLDSNVARFSSFPASTHNTGSLYFQNINGDEFADGRNGYNVNRTEQGLIPGRPTGSQNIDMQRVSLRLKLGSLGDRVWSDTDRNGIQDPGEPGLGGVTVELLDADGKVVGTTTTAADGSYRFTDLPLGDYRIRVTPPDGRSFAPRGAGDDSAADSDIDPATGESGTVSLTTDAPDDDTVDAGILPVGPAAHPDESSGPQGVPQSVAPLANDEAGDDSAPLDPDSLTLLDEDGNPTDSVTVAGEGTYTVEDGKLVFTPEPQFTGTATPVDYQIADVNGATARSTYTPTIEPVSPTANPDETSGPQGQPQSVDPLGNDEAGDDAVPLDPDSLTLLDADGNPTETVAVPGQGTYTVEDGKLVFTPEPGFVGTADPVDYQVADVNGTTTKSTYTPTVTPVAQPDETSGPQGQPQSVDPLENDGADGVELDPDTLTLVDEDGNPVDSVTVPGEGVYTVEDGKIVFTPEPSFTGEATPVRYQVKDTDGNTVESTYTPTVTPVTPTANPDQTSGPQGVPQSVDPLINDGAGDDSAPLDPDSLTLLDADGNPVSSVTVDGQGTYTVEDGRLVFTPEPQFTGTADPVDYQVADTNGTTAKSTYTPTINPVTPTASPDVSSGPQGKPQSVDPLANDAAGDDDVPLDPDSLTLLDADGNPTDTVTVPGEGVYTVEDGKLVFTPEPGFTGTATPVDYRVADVNGTPAESTYTPTVGTVANPDVTSGPQGQPQSVDPLENDGADGVELDPDTLTLVDEDGNPTDTVTVPGEGTYKVEDGKIVFTPEPGFTGEATPVRYQVKDTDGNPVESTYTPTVTPVTPTANPDQTSGPQGQPQSVDPLTNDEAGDDAVPLDPDSLTLLDADGNPTDSVTSPGEGVYTVEDGKLVFTPEPQFTGTATPVDYQVADTNGTTAKSTYTPTINPVTPTANPDETSGPQGQPQSIDPLTNDEAGDDSAPLDPDSLTLLDEDGNPTDSVTIPGEGTYTVQDGKLVFTPEPQFTGTATPVEYQVADTNGTTAKSTYTPTITPVTPTANPDETSGPQGQPQSIDPLANDEAGDDSAPLDPDSLTLLDADGNPTDSVTIPGEGTYTVEDGKLVFTPEPQFTGTATPVDYQVADTNGTTAKSTYTPTINPVTPTANPDETSGPQGVPQS